MRQAVSRLNAALQGRYTIERELGEGGMATVYLAHDLRHDRRVAVKVLRPELAAAIGAERFLAEIKTTANLQHPHALPLHDSGVADGFLFYVMPYVEGESLAERLVREKQLPVDEAVAIARAVAGALQAAHEQGIVHRDLKPQNILLSHGEALVADFGIALAVGSVGEDRMTETGVSLGTPYYMSPEQASGERHLDGRSDVYSLACVLYEMLTGEPPFRGSTVQAVLARIITGELAPPTEHRPSVPLHVECAITKGLERLPADRFQSARAFADALGDASFRHGRASRSAPGGRAWIRDVRSQAALVAAAIGVASLGWASNRGPEASTPVWFRLGPPEPSTLVGSAPAVSPSGDLLAYAAQGPDGVGRIYVRPLGSADAVAVPGSDSARSVFFSPDGGWLGFSVGSGGLRKIPLAGGVATTVFSDAGGTFVGGNAWVSNDRILHLEQDRAWSVDAAGGLSLTPLTPVSLDGQRYTVTGVMGMPGVNGVLVDYLLDSEVPDLGVVDLQTGELKTLVEDARGVGMWLGHLLYARSDGAVLAVPFDAGRLEIDGAATTLPLNLGTAVRRRWSESGSTFAYLEGGEVLSELVLVDRAGAESPLPGAPFKTWLFPRFSPDGRRIAAEIHERGGHIWVYDLASATLSRVTSVGHNTRPAWSPDGSRLAYWRLGQAVGTDGDLYTRAADGSEAEVRVAGSGGRSGSIDWMPGAGSLLLDFDGDLWTIPLEGDSALTPIVASPATEVGGVVSADGRWLAYVSDESGDDQVYVRAVDGAGGRFAVSSGGGVAPAWAPRGTELFYVSPEGLVAAELRFEPEFEVSRALLFDHAEFRELGRDPTYAVHPDGQRFLVPRASGQEDLRIRVITNFEEQLRRWLAG